MMIRPKQLLPALALILYGLSLVFVRSSFYHTSLAVHAQDTVQFTVTAGKINDKQINININVTAGADKVKAWGYWRQPMDTAPQHFATSSNAGIIDTFLDLHNQTPPSGPFNYMVKAYSSQADADAQKNEIGGAISNVINGSGGGDLTVSASATGNDVIVNWTAVANATKYAISFAPSTADGTTTNKATSAGTVNTPTTSFTHKNVANGTYVYQVVAQDNSGNTVASSPLSSPIVVPSTPPGGGTSGGTGALGGGAAGGGAGGNDVSFTQGDAANQCTQSYAANDPSSPTNKAKNTLQAQDLYTVIGGKDIQTIYKWVLSLVNLALLIFLIAMAFSNILHLQVDTYAMKKILPALILGVVLANFSWLICRFITETASVLYHGLVDAYATGGKTGAQVLFSKLVEGYGINSSTMFCETATKSFGSGMLSVFVGTVLIVVAAILLLTLYILLLARIWILTLMFIVSPLAFLALGFPVTQQYFKKWWATFLSWAFMAPASFLIVVLATKLNGINDLLTRYILMTALLYFAVQVPFKMGGAWMQQWGKYVSQFKQKAAQPIKNQGKAVQDWASKGYDFQKQLLKDKAKVKMWESGAGRFIARGQEKMRVSRATTDSKLTDARGAGAHEFRTSEKGQRYLAAKTKADSAAKAREDELSKAESLAAEKYYKGYYKDVRGIGAGDRTRSLTAETEKEIQEALLEAAKSGKALEFFEGAKGEALIRRLTDAGMSKEASENFLKNLKNKQALEFRRADERRGRDGTSGQLAKARLESSTSEAALKKADERIEGEERMAKLREDMDFAKSDDEYKAAQKRYNDFIENNPVYKGLLKAETEAEDIVKEYWEKMGDRKAELLSDIQRANPTESADEHQKKLEAALTTDPTFNSHRAYMDRAQDIATKAREKLTSDWADATNEYTAAKQKRASYMTVAAENSYEAQADQISVDDALKENSTEIGMAFSKSDMGKIINAKRAMWRTFIQRNETVIAEELDRAFVDLIRLDQKGIAKRLGKGHNTLEVSELVNDYTYHNIEAGIAKEMREKETRKGEMRVALRMAMPQNMIDRQRLLQNSIDVLDKDIVELAASTDPRAPDNLAAARLRREQQQQDLDKQKEQMNKYIKSIHDSVKGNLSLLPPEMKRFFTDTVIDPNTKKVVKDRHGDDVTLDPTTGWRLKQDFEWDEGRKLYDRIRGMIGTELQSRSRGLLESKSPKQLIMELYGKGDDTYDKRVMEAITEHRVADAFEFLGFKEGQDPRNFEKPSEAEWALSTLAARRREGYEARAALIRTDTDGIVERTISELAVDQTLRSEWEKASKSNDALIAAGKAAKALTGAAKYFEEALSMAKELQAGKKIDLEAARNFLISGNEDKLINLTVAARQRAKNETNIAQRG